MEQARPSPQHGNATSEESLADHLLVVEPLDYVADEAQRRARIGARLEAAMHRADARDAAAAAKRVADQT